MRSILTIFLSLLFYPVFSQGVPDLIAKVITAQQSIHTLHYTIERSDTFVTGDTRIGRGEVDMKSLPEDQLLGFAFHAKKNGIAQETIYDGHSAFVINHEAKNYQSFIAPTNANFFMGSPGGQMVLPDVIRLDTATATGFSLQQDADNYYLTMRLPDITLYDVSLRSTVFTINKKSMLPVAVRKHQETLGKVQDLYYRLLEMKVNDAPLAYNFSTERFPADYTSVTKGANKQLLLLKDQPLPAFQLTSFTAAPISTSQFAGKVVLLDFWEVWCGPCIASMPKVQAIYDKYKSQGLLVYGLMSEKEQLEVAKLLVAKRKIDFPMLVSDKQVMKQYGVLAVPTYILIDKKGNIRFTSEGFSEGMEEEIKNLLN